MTGEPVLWVEGLRVEVATASGPRTVLERVGFELGAAEILAIRGRSGAGKTSLVRALLGLQPAVSGRIGTGRLDLDLGELAPRSGASWSELRRSVAAVFQNAEGSLDPRMRVKAQLDEIRSRSGEGRSAAALLESVAAPIALLRRFPHQLSGGEARRVVLARALAHRPRVLIADEPTRGLDPGHRDRVVAVLRRLRTEERIAILLITHDHRVVEALADRVLVLRDGLLEDRSRDERPPVGPAARPPRRGDRAGRE